MKEQITSENSVTLQEAEQSFEAVCDRVHANSPLFITKNGKPCLVVFDFHDYLVRFGQLLPADEYAQLRKLDGP